MIRRYLPKDVQELIRWYERYVSPASLVAGFLADNLFLTKRVDLFRTNALLISYLVVAALSIVLINVKEVKGLKRSWALKLAPFIPVAAQFCFGGLLSGFLSLYSRSAGFVGSWIFIAVLALLIVGNERFMRLYVRFSVQFALYFFVLFSYLAFFLPVVFHQIGPGMFVASGVASIVVIRLLFRAHRILVPTMPFAERKRAGFAVAGVFVVFSTLYFANIIPPLPLALKDAGVYHAVVHRADGSYVLSGESVPWYEKILPITPTVHLVPGQPVYVFTSVFAPSGLSTNILHQWQYYDPTNKTWMTEGTVGFPIVGGRDGGYRGYSEKTDLQDGLWRVNVVTQYGGLIGRIYFYAVSVSTTPPLSTDIIGP